jgi:small subunit ribosomal protein S16
MVLEGEREFMLAIRLRRVGSKKRPHFRVVVIESENPRDGSFVEILGHYHPRSRPARVEVDRDGCSLVGRAGLRHGPTLVAKHSPSCRRSAGGS